MLITEQPCDTHLFHENHCIHLAGYAVTKDIIKAYVFPVDLDLKTLVHNIFRELKIVLIMAQRVGSPHACEKPDRRETHPSEYVFLTSSRFILNYNCRYPENRFLIVVIRADVVKLPGPGFPVFPFRQINQYRSCFLGHTGASGYHF
jgi:hypothetical protein